MACRHSCRHVSGTLSGDPLATGGARDNVSLIDGALECLMKCPTACPHAEALFAQLRDCWALLLDRQVAGCRRLTQPTSGWGASGLSSHSSIFIMPTRVRSSTLSLLSQSRQWSCRWARQVSENYNFPEHDVDLSP